MGAKQSSPVFDGRTRAYSSSDLPSGNSSGGERIAGFRYTNGPDGPRIRYTGGGPTSSGRSIPAGGRSGSHGLNQSLDGMEDGGEDGELPPEGHRLLIGSLPAHLSPHLMGGFHCPVCSKFMASDEIEKHLLMCFSKTRLTYNSKKLKGQEAMEGYQYSSGHRQQQAFWCIDEWFEVNRSCPEHPAD
ncbi:hypothetical protein FQN60_007712 [Etheostoma spectabile]|uniref:RING-type E3 ubiquitin transferase n=1 Tax=Etheostoma spectabile TaxID=54343 RepID=A0A5J5CZ25_9PERO|nr:hypothetical protein FQN60_007712 [Etheostoma spectabile]